MLINDVRKEKKTVCIVGMGLTQPLAPYDNKDVEIWCINEAYKLDEYYDRKVRADRWFQLHCRWDFTRMINPSDPHGGHFEWLKQDHPFPIYMQKKYADIPASVRYPLEEICGMFSLDRHTCWFRNSICYQVAFAIYEGFERIEMYGWSLSSNTERAYEKPAAVFWLGIAKGMGIDIYLPPAAELMGWNKRLYAFEDVPAINRMHCESRSYRAQQKATHAQRFMREHLGDRDARDNFFEAQGERMAWEQMMDELDDVSDPRGTFDKDTNNARTAR